MLKTNDIQIEKIDLAVTNISVTFEDLEVQPEKYTFLKDRLNKFKYYINSEYSLKTELQYNNSSQLLLIGIRIVIPDNYIPEDPIKADKIILDPINTFQMFYDAQNEIYKRKH